MHRPLSRLTIFILSFSLLISCSTERQLSKKAHASLLDKKELTSAHVGICIFDPSANKYLYNYQSDRFFIPASNTKLFSLYAGLKYLPDSLVAARVALDGS